jgi:hypothetical protein
MNRLWYRFLVISFLIQILFLKAQSNEAHLLLVLILSPRFCRFVFQLLLFNSNSYFFFASFLILGYLTGTMKQPRRSL